MIKGVNGARLAALGLLIAAIASGCGDDDPESSSTARPVFQVPEGVSFETQSPVLIPNAANITGESGSVAFNLTPSWNEMDQSALQLFRLGRPGQRENHLELTKNGPFLRFLLFDNEGIENGIGFRLRDWAPGEKHSIAVTWGPEPDGERVIQLFVDGHLVGVRSYENPFLIPGNEPMIVGDDSGDLGARATLEGFQVFNAPLDAARVAALNFGAKHTPTPTPDVIGNRPHNDGSSTTSWPNYRLQPTAASRPFQLTAAAAEPRRSAA